MFIDKKKKGKKGLKFVVTDEIRDEIGMNSPNQQAVQLDFEEQE